MNRTKPEQRAHILQLLCEGMSIRAIERTTGASKHTIIRLLNDAGQALGALQDRLYRDLKTKRVQVDEIWSFTYAKQKNVADAKAAPASASPSRLARRALTRPRSARSMGGTCPGWRESSRASSSPVAAVS